MKKNAPAKFPPQANNNRLRAEFTAATREAQAKLASAPHSYVFFAGNVAPAACIKAVTAQELGELVAAEGGQQLRKFIAGGDVSAHHGRRELDAEHIGDN